MSPKKKSKRKNNDSKKLDEFIETGHKLTQQGSNLISGNLQTFSEALLMPQIIRTTSLVYKNYIFGHPFLN